MQIISGKYKGKKLDGYNIKGTRPTMGRIKESLFAMLNPYLDESSCLDLFAGSGSLGLEAISNGAKELVLVDNNPIVIKTLKHNIQNIKEDITIVKDDYINYLKKCNKNFDIIFLDPPYDDNLISKAIELIIKNNLLKDNGLLVCECEKENIICPYNLIKNKSYGGKNIKIFQK